MKDKLAYINAVVDVRKHCTKDCRIDVETINRLPKDIWCKRFCSLYKYRKEHEETGDYEIRFILLCELIESFCYRYCRHEHCNNCTFRKYHEAYGK